MVDAPIRVFISYPSEDTNIAETVRTELMSFGVDRVSVFHDASDLRSGADWEGVISYKLAGADLLIAIHTGRRRSAFSFPGWEIGAFTALAKDSPDKQVFCLYDTKDIPDLFKQYQNRRIQFPSSDHDDEFYRKTDLWRFLTEFEALCRRRISAQSVDEVSVANFYENIKMRAAKSITSAFATAQKNDVETEYFGLRRIIIEVEDGNFFRQDPRRIPRSATVKLETNAFAILGIQPEYDNNGLLKAYTWGKLLDLARDNGNYSAPWMDQVSEIVVDTLRNAGIGAQPQISFLSAPPDRQVYRALLTRHQLLKGGGRRFYLDFVLAYPKKFPGDETSSQILIGLIFASRFRFLFLENSADSYIRRLKTAPAESQAPIIRQLMKDLDRMPMEAAEFGLSDAQNLLFILGDQHEAEVEGFFRTWTEEREKLRIAYDEIVDVSEGQSKSRFLDAVEAFRDNLAPLNRAFIKIMLSKYLDLLRIEQPRN